MVAQVNKILNTPKKKTCFDLKTQQAVIIAMGRLPSADAMKEAIRHFDEKVISADQLSLVSRIWPKPEEISRLIDENVSKGEEEKWDKGEEFILEMLKMPDVNHCINVWLVKQEFPEKMDSQLQVLKMLKAAFEEVTMNKTMKKCF